MNEMEAYTPPVRNFQNFPVVQRIRGDMEYSKRGSVRLEKLCNQIDAVENQLETYSKLFVELKKSRQHLDNLSCEQQIEKLQYSESKEKSMFERLFGLKFELTEEQKVCLEFGNLTSGTPHLTCSITMDVNGLNQWEVCDVSPALDGIFSLVDQLNKTGNFGLFCKKTRGQFKIAVQQL